MMSIKSPKICLATLTCGHLFGNCTIMAVAAIATNLKTELEISAENYGWLIAIYMIVQGLIAIPGGLLIDYIGTRSVFAISMLLTGGGTAIVGGASTFEIACLGMLLLGAGYGLVNPCTSKTVFDVFPRERRASAMGIKQTGVPLGGVLGAMISGALIDTFNRNEILFGFASVITLASGLAFLLPRHNDRPDFKPIKGMLTIIRDKNLQIFNASIGIFQASMYAMLANIAAFCREFLTIDPTTSAACLSITQTASAIGRLGWGVISDRIYAAKRKPVLFLIGIIGTISLLAIAVASPRWPSYVVLALAFPLGLATAGYVGLTQTVCVETADKNFTATAIGTNRIFTSAGAGMALPFFGWIVDNSGYQFAWLTLAVFFAVGTLVLKLFFRERTT